MRAPFRTRSMLLAFTMSTMSFAATTTQIPDELKPYIALTNSDQPQFRSLVEALLTPQQLADYAPVIPYGVVIRNISTAPLRGYSVAFVREPGTPPMNTYSAVDNAIVPLGLFQPGQTRFYMPGVRVEPPALEPGQTGARMGRMSASAPIAMSAIAQHLGTLGSITASVEFVVTQAGKILGPDRFKDAKIVQDGEQALMDLASRVRSHGSDMAGLAADLDALAQTKVTNRYTGALRANAKTLHMSVTRGTDPEAVVRAFLAGPGSGIVISR